MNQIDDIEQYRSKYNLSITAASVEIGITETGYRMYLLSTKNRRQPSPIVCRTVQLLDFIRSQGLEPPASNQ
ncbi:MAG: hypothetical protein KME29_04990 [Calothrix sp. FI2-JRJ7]|jgi:hypothetical protein|nr:hypothetical protein [Calothrix sp. FI2-JRJ7]